MFILAGDIGGTNTRLRLVEIDEKKQLVVAEKDFLSRDYDNLADVFNKFKSEYELSISIDAACMAVAGPVKRGVVSVTNLPWVIRESELSELLETKNVCLINDFLAVSYGISDLDVSDTITIQNNDNNDETDWTNAAAVIGAGTGLGASHLVWNDSNFQAFPSEAGHAGFAAETGQQSELLNWLRESSSHISLENVLSGSGLQRIYEFLRDTTDVSESIEVKKAMEDEDPAKIITEYALLGSDLLCQKTIDCFVDIYGAAAGNIALHYYPLKSVYIAGGIAVKIKNKIASERFLNAFTNKGKMSENMKQITVKLVLNERLGLYGATSYAYRVFAK